MKKSFFNLIFVSSLSLSVPVFAMDEDRGAKGLPSSKTWEFLKPGETIDVIAPAAAATDDQLKVGSELISELKYIANLPKIDAPSSLAGYYANSHKVRATQFKAALEGPGKALWAVRGGFGSIETISWLGKYTPPRAVKPIVGFSDITSFHLLAATWNWPSLFGPVLSLGEEAKSAPAINKGASLTSVVNCLSGEKTELKYTFDVWQKASAEDPIKGSILGGNLSIIEAHKGTPTALKGKNRFVFLEDTSEDVKRLSRRLTGLLQAGVFDEAKGVLIGDMPITGATLSTEKFIQSFFADVKELTDIDIPVLYSPRFGHGHHNDVLPFGTEAQMEVGDDKATLTVKVNKSAYPDKSK